MIPQDDVADALPESSRPRPRIDPDTLFDHRRRIERRDIIDALRTPPPPSAGPQDAPKC